MTALRLRFFQFCVLIWIDLGFRNFYMCSVILFTYYLTLLLIYICLVAMEAHWKIYPIFLYFVMTFIKRIWTHLFIKMNKIYLKCICKPILYSANLWNNKQLGMLQHALGSMQMTCSFKVQITNICSDSNICNLKKIMKFGKKQNLSHVLLLFFFENSLVIMENKLQPFILMETFSPHSSLLATLTHFPF